MIGIASCPVIAYQALENQRTYQRWLASLTKAELLEYSDIKMMSRQAMLNSWRAARKAMR